MLLQANLFLLQFFKVARNFQCVFWRLLLGRFFLLDEALLLSGCFGQHVTLFAFGFGCLSLGTTAFKRPANRGHSSAQHRTANKAVDVFFTGIFICKICACLQPFQNLLHCFSQAFPAHGRARLKGVVRNSLAQRLRRNCLGLLSGQLGAHGAEQLAHTGQQCHGGGIQKGLRHGSSGGFTEAGFFQRLAFPHLSGNVGTRKLPCGQSTCACQTQARSNRGGYWSGQSRKTCGSRSQHVRHGAAQCLFEFLERGFGPAFFGGGEAGSSLGFLRFLIRLCLRDAHYSQLTGSQRSLALEAFNTGSGSSFETLGVLGRRFLFFLAPKRFGVHLLCSSPCLCGGFSLTNCYCCAVW